MPQTVQVLRTITNNAPPALLPGAMSVETSGHTKLWLGSHTGNRLLISDNPAELPIAGNNYLPLAGGQLQGGINFGSQAVGTPSDLSRHIALWGGNYGLSVTGGRMNIVAPQHVFTNGNTDVLTISSALSGGGPGLALNGAANAFRSYMIYANGVPRWTFQANTADNLAINGFNDAGGSLGPWMTMTRTTGATTFTGLMTLSAAGTGLSVTNNAIVNGTITIGNAAAAAAIALSINGAQNTARGIRWHTAGSIRWLMQLAAAESEGNLGSDFQFARYSDTGAFLSFPMQVNRATGIVTLGQLGNTTIGQDTSPGAYGLTLNGPAASQRRLLWQTASSNRWLLYLPTAESGSNTGSDFYLVRYDDTGASLGNALIIARSTGMATFGSGVSFGSRTAAGGAGDMSQHISLFSNTFGFGITAARLNYNVPATNSHFFRTGALDRVQITDAGIVMQGTSTITLTGAPTANLHATSKQYVDDLVGSVESVTTLAGSYDVAADLVRPVPGVSVAGPLPAAGPANFGWYLIVEEQGVGIGNAPPVQMYVGDWLISNSTSWVHLNLNLETVEAHNVAIAPIPDLISTNVQDALAELPTKSYVDAHDPAFGNYLPITGGELSGTLLVGNGRILSRGPNNPSVTVWHTSLSSAAGILLGGETPTLYFAVMNGNGDYEYALGTWDFSGHLWSAGGIVSGANIVASGQCSGESIASYGGHFFVSTNPAYYVYIGRGQGDAVWRWVEGPWTNMSLTPDGDLFTRGNTVTNALFAADIFLDPSQTYALFTSADGTRWTQYNTGWAWGYQPSTGHLVWNNNNNSAANVWLAGDGLCYNMEGGVWRTFFADARLGTEIADYTAGLDVISRLRPRTYRVASVVARHGADAPLHIGLLAQECEAVLPAAIDSRAIEVDGVHYDDLRTYTSTPLLYALVNSVNELNARLTAGGL